MKEGDRDRDRQTGKQQKEILSTALPLKGQLERGMEEVKALSRSVAWVTGTPIL